MNNKHNKMMAINKILNKIKYQLMEIKINQKINNQKIKENFNPQNRVNNK